MKKVNLYIAEKQAEWLSEQTKKLGLSGMSELLRKIIDKAKGE